MRLKRYSIWNSWDLDYILNQGHSFFKSLHLTGPLAVDEMPRNVVVEDQLVKVELYHMSTICLVKKNLFESHNNISREDIGHGAIFICVGYSFSLILTENTQTIFCLICTVKLMIVFKFPITHQPFLSFLSFFLVPAMGHNMTSNIKLESRRMLYPQLSHL